MCLTGPVAGVREKPSESHASERRDALTKRNGWSRHLDLKSINSIFTSYVFVIISECIIPCVHVYNLSGPNRKSIVSISVGIVVCRRLGVYGIQRLFLLSRGYSLIEILVANRGVAP